MLPQPKTLDKKSGRANEERPVSKRDSILETASDLLDRVRNKLHPKPVYPKVAILPTPPDPELAKRIRAAQIEARRIDRTFGMLCVDRCLADTPPDWLETLPSFAYLDRWGMRRDRQAAIDELRLVHTERLKNYERERRRRQTRT